MHSLDPQRASRPSLIAPLAALGALSLAGCGGFGSSSDSDEVSVTDLPHAVSASLQEVVGGDWLVYLADEAETGPGGTDLDGDGSADGLVTVAYDMDGERDYPLGVLPVATTVLNEEVVFLAVDEGMDGKDWSEDGDEEDLVLLSWTEDDGVLRLVDELRVTPAGLPFETSTGRLYYSAAVEPAGADSTSLRYVTADAPTIPVEVSAVPGHGEMRPAILGADAELLFLAIDETVEGGDRNGDGDDEDAAVLVLLDGREELAAIASTGLALNAESPVFGALKLKEDGAYRAAFLVSEAAQGGVSLNDAALFDPAWEAAQCAGAPDLDAEDDVLFTARLAGLVAGTEEPLNTGIAGRDRVVVAGKHVVTLSAEADAGCDLNVDGDQDDVVVRWAEATDPVLPVVLSEDMLAVAAVPGGAFGLARLNGQLVAAIDEVADSRDHDGDGEMSRVLLGWRDPAMPPWIFLHCDIDPDEDIELYVGVEWMAPLPQEERLPISFTEEAQGTSLNYACDLEPHDDDVDDVLPAWVRFPFDDNDPSEMFVSGLGMALPESAGGVVLSEIRAYFRVSELEDSMDHDEDGDLDDIVLMRSSLLACDPKFIGVVEDDSGPAITTGGEEWGVFRALESLAGEDFNEDGDTEDLTLRYIRL